MLQLDFFCLIDCKTVSLSSAYNFLSSSISSGLPALFKILLEFIKISNQLLILCIPQQYGIRYMVQYELALVLLYCVEIYVRISE